MAIPAMIAIALWGTRSMVCEAWAMNSLPPAQQWLVDGAIEVARAGGKTTLETFRKSSLEVEHKSDGSPVTIADRNAEAVIRQLVLELTPEASIVGEEHGSTTGEGQYKWYVDPIDGTKAFIRGVPLYSTLVGVADENGLAAGVIYIPATDEIVWAGRGLGAFTPDGPAQMSNRSGLDGAFISTSSAGRWGTSVYSRVVNAGASILGWGDGYGFLMAATGRIDAMMDIGAGNPWDWAPMPVIMSEAGGQFTAVDGTETIFSPDGIAANSAISKELVDIHTA
jgi:histidinol-phosphatase